MAAALTVGVVKAAELRVISSNGVTAVMHELGPRFEQATGYKLVIRFGAAALLRKEIEAGATFDVAILTVPHVEALTQQGRLVAGSSANIARSGIGVSIRAGAPKPDISTTEAFRQTMLAARSVAYSGAGSSGENFVRVLQRLGIAEEMKPKARVRPSGPTGELVVKGEAELAVQQISELLPVAGTQFVGPFPPELQVYTTFTAAVGPAARDSAAARMLLKFLIAPDALPVIKAKGMEPA
jgi:molybdate transport system substrate-binding protein